MHVHAAATSRQANLRPPEPDPRSVSRQHPDRLALLPALDDREAEIARVETLGRIEVDDLEDELVDAGYRDPCHPSRRKIRVWMPSRRMPSTMSAIPAAMANATSNAFQVLFSNALPPKYPSRPA